MAVALAAAWAWALASPPPQTPAVAEATAEATAELSWEKPPAEEDALEEQAGWAGSGVWGRVGGFGGEGPAQNP